MDRHKAGMGCVGAAKAAKGVTGHCVAVRPLPDHRASRRSHRAGIASAQVPSSKRRGGPHPDRQGPKNRDSGNPWLFHV